MFFVPYGCHHTNGLWSGCSSPMTPLRARVEKGRLVLDEPTILPDRTIIDLVADDEGDDLTDEERRALHEALFASWKSAEAGRLRGSGLRRHPRRTIHRRLYRQSPYLVPAASCSRHSLAHLLCPMPGRGQGACDLARTAQRRATAAHKVDVPFLWGAWRPVLGPSGAPLPSGLTRKLRRVNEIIDTATNQEVAGKLSVSRVSGPRRQAPVPPQPSVLGASAHPGVA